MEKGKLGRIANCVGILNMALSWLLGRLGVKINSFPSLDGRQGCIFRLYCMRRGYLIDISTYIHMLQ